jgi:hypothetical protein
MATEQEGGRLYDQGLYGCIYTERLRCKDGKGVGEGQGQGRPLTKISATEDAQQEYRISDAIRKIPQWGQYFAVAEAMCEPAEKQVEKELDQCGMIQDASLSEFRILSMTHRGVPLHRYAFPLRAGFDFGRFALHLVEGSALLALFGVVHRDMHRGNILVDQHMVPRIIDFNLSVRSTAVKAARDIQHGHSFVITQEPPDSVVVNAVSLGYKAPKVLAGLMEKKPTLKVISMVLGVPLAQMEDDIRTFHAKSKSMQAGDLVGWFRAYWPKIDSWAVGVALVEVIQRLSVWPEFVWNRARWLPILRGMCAVSPLKRMDCVEALRMLDPGNVILRKYGSRWRGGGAGYADGAVEDSL